MTSAAREPSAIAPWLVVALLATAVWTAMPAHGGADLLLYQRMARAALAGSDPYADPYADFPPLKMLVLVVLQRWNAWALFRALGIFAVAAAAFGLARRIETRASAMPLALVLTFQPLIFQNWVAPFEDKFLYPAVLLPALALTVPDDWVTRGARRAIVASLFGVLAAYSGVTLLLIPLMALEIWRRSRRAGDALAAVAIAGSIVILSHAAFFPGWVQGYAHRWARQTFEHPVHESLFVLLDSVHLYRPWLPTVTTVLAVSALSLAWWRGLAFRHTAALMAWASLAFGPDASYDRLMAATFPVFILLIPSPIAATGVAVLMMTIGARVGAPDFQRGPAVVAALWLPIAVGVVALLALAIRGRDSEGSHPDPQGP